MDVLVFVPVYRLESETVAAVMELAMEPWDGAVSVLFQRDNPTDSGRLNILHQYQRARQQFLSGNFDAMLVIESDIVPPVDALRKLAALDANCAYGVYRFRVSNVINIYERYPGRPKNLGSSLSLEPRKLRDAVRKGQVECSGGGLGCVLIQRHVLEEIDFRMGDPKGAHCDTFFNRDVLRGGFSQRADMTVVCGHKDEYGDMLWPELPGQGQALPEQGLPEQVTASA